MEKKLEDGIAKRNQFYKPLQIKNKNKKGTKFER